MSQKTPKYQRIANELRIAIRSGQYRPGDQIPSENSLIAAYGVARMTVRQAFRVLCDEGLVESRKGSGVFVRTFQPLRRRGIQRLSETQWGEGRSIWEFDTDRTLVVDQIHVTQETPSPEIATVLGLGPDDPVCVRNRRFVLENNPVLLARSFLPGELVSGTAITQEDTGPGGVYARLAELGHAPAHFREEIRCRMPTPNQTEDLCLPHGTPVIQICRTAFTAEGHAVETNEMIMDSASFILEYDFDA